MENEDIILHLDLDYFFAQLEIVKDPQIRTKPVVICVYSGRTKDSGAVSTCNYVARSYGVKSGIPIKRAIKLLGNTDSVFLPSKIEEYKKTSNEIMKTIKDYGDSFEIASIDECYLDITNKSKLNYLKAQEIAKKIKNRIKSSFGLTCSIGVGPNKLVAKMASDLRKPDGLTIIKPEKVEDYFNELEVDKIPGIGKKKKEILAEYKIKTISDLRKATRSFLIEKFGEKTGSWMYNASRCIDRGKVIQKEQKQIGKILTLKQDTRDLNTILEEKNKLIDEISLELKKKKVSFMSITAMIMDEKIQMHTKSQTLDSPKTKIQDLEEEIGELFKKLLSNTDLKIRRIGIKIDKLSKKTGQKNLFDF